MDPTSDTHRLDPPNAATKVFSTFELLENILILVSQANLPYKDENYISRAQKLRLLYPLQRINKTSRNVIDRSKTLREHMFKTHNDNEDVDQSEALWKRAKRILNPFAAVMYCLVPLGRLGFSIRDLSPDQMRIGARVLALDGSTRLQEARQLPRAASWRQMVISRKSVEIIVRVNVEVRGSTDRYGDFKLVKGSTLGELADIVVSMIEMEDIHETKRAREENAEEDAKRKRRRRESVFVCVPKIDEDELLDYIDPPDSASDDSDR